MIDPTRRRMTAGRQSYNTTSAAVAAVLSVLLLFLAVRCCRTADLPPQRGVPEQYVLVVGGEDDDNGTIFSDPNAQDDDATTPPAGASDPSFLAWDQPIDHDHDAVVLVNVRILAHDPTDPTQLPTDIELSFTYADQFIVIRLTRNDNIRTSIPVYANGTLLRDPAKAQGYAFYFDVIYQSSVLLEKVFDDARNSTVFLYSGSFHLNGTEFGFEPVSQPTQAKRRRRRSPHPSAARRPRRQTDDDGDGDGQFQIYEKKRVLSDPFESRFEPYLNYRLNDSSPSELQSDAIGSKSVYTVEILGVIDYRIYFGWYNRSAYPTNSQKMTDAVNNIVFYFGHVFNGIDMRYRSIVDSQFSISTVLVGLYIAVRPSDASYVENNRQDGYPLGSVDANAVLDDFSTWLRTHQGVLPPFDQASLFTSEIMIGLSGNRISGLAIIQGICTNYSISFSKNLGEYSATETGAHELGHNLGAGHDGVDNSCNGDDLYIMSAFPGLLTDAVYKNAFHFSPCSISEFRIFLGQLAASPRPADHCLLDRHNVTFNLTSIIGQQSGQRYDPNAQCVIIYGTGAYYCGGNAEDANICRTMECFHPQYRYCYAVYEQRAFDGTTCGNKTWCQLGDCVYDPKAPVARAQCVYGDYAGPYTNGLSCQTIATSATWNCYNSFYYDDCCDSCPRIRNSSRVGCEFGDHDGTCVTMDLFGCYNGSVRTSCCDRCKSPANIAGCEYGDKAEWCSQLIQTAFNCYAYGSTCCDTCRKYNTGVAGCSYGDRATWCQTISRSYCYTSQSDCCLTCLRLKNASAVGCEYGDKADWCNSVQSYQCYADGSTCCDSCNRFRQNVAGCEFGDHLQLCVNGLQAYQCYTYASYCCVGCPRYYTGISGCEYGNREAGCSSNDCGDPYRRNICCYTCAIATLPITTRTSTLPTTTTSTTTPTTTTTTRTTSTSSTTTMTTTLTRAPTSTAKTAQSVTTQSATLESTSICAVGDDKTSYCSTMPARDCYILADTCCETCRDSYMNLNGCEYGNRVGWCESYLRDQSGCLRDGNAFFCCSTCATTYGVQCTDTVGWCDRIRPWDCYDNQYQANYCCATCRRYRAGNRAGCDYGDRVTWCANYALSYICSTNPVDCCKTCQSNR